MGNRPTRPCAFTRSPFWQSRDVLTFDEPLQLIGYLAFPVGALLIMAWALYMTLRWKKYGISTAHLLDNPGLVGGWLRLEVRSKLRPGPADRILATLKCRYRSQSSDGKSSMHLVWKFNYDIPPGQCRRNDGGTSSIPVALYIPYDAIDASTTHEWTLELKGKVAGPDYYAAFRVPVFKTGQSVLEVPQEAVEIFGDTVAPHEEYHETSRARVEVLPGGGLEVTTPPVSFIPIKLVALAFTAICIFFTGAILMETPFHFMPFLIGVFFSGIMLLLSAWLLFGKRRILLQDKAVTHQLRIFILKRAAVSSPWTP